MRDYYSSTLPILCIDVFVRLIRHTSSHILISITKKPKKNSSWEHQNNCYLMTLDSMAVNNHTRWAQIIRVGNKMTVLYYFCIKKAGHVHILLFCLWLCNQSKHVTRSLISFDVIGNPVSTGPHSKVKFPRRFLLRDELACGACRQPTKSRGASVTASARNMTSPMHDID